MTKLKAGPLKQMLTMLMHGHVSTEAKQTNLEWLQKLSAMRSQGVFDDVQIRFIDATIELMVMHG